LPTPDEFEEVKKVHDNNTASESYIVRSAEVDRKNESADVERSSAEDMERSAVGADGFSAVDELNIRHSTPAKIFKSSESNKSASSTDTIVETCPVITEKEILSGDNSESYNYLILRIGKNVDESTVLENGTCKLGSEKDSTTRSLR
jgi:hypothetical protein